MISRIAEGNAVEAPEALAALQDAWDGLGVEERRASQKAKQPRALDLHLVPQMKLSEAEKAFPCLDPKYPTAWKQQVRQLRNRLTHFDGEMNGQLKVVSLLSMNGQRPRKGLAPNLAFALAAMEETKVLLIDAKAERPDLDLQLGLTEARGLCDATRAHREDLPDCFRRIAGTQLYLLPFGQTLRYEGESMDLRGMQRLLSGLRQQFDWIVIDGPGFDTPADATLVTLCSDGTVYLVDQGVDRFEDLRLAFQQTQGRYMLGAVMV
ncbi:MAG: CpsD/CapB family tyrosine-protein kinase [Acidobacteria bacterium]|nr:CpsD/CapB family tyrosine-protein kinase [Acidobacteriota bacterium]